MPYTTDRGVRIYSDHNTAPEFASAADEDRYRYNRERDIAFDVAEQIAAALDARYDDPFCGGDAMTAIANDLDAILKRITTHAAR